MPENARSADDITDYLGHLLQEIIGFIPELLGALAILFIGYLIAKGIAAAVYKLLGKADLNDKLHSGQGGSFIQRAVPDPQGLIATITYWVIFLFAISIAVSVLGIPILAEIVQAIYAYIPNVIAALLIFLVAGTVAGAVAGLVKNTMGDTPTGKVVGTVAPVIIMAIATFMILNQLQIAPAIVTTLFAAIVFGLALGMALAFGLGGRDVAARMLQGMYEKSQANKGQIAGDFKHGANNAKAKGQQLRDQ